MNLNKNQTREIEYVMWLAKQQKRSNELVDIKLYSDKKGTEEVKSKLIEVYEAKDIKNFPLFDRGKRSTLYLKVPIKNLKKVLEENYIKKYNWPEELETLSKSERPPSLGFTTSHRAPDHIEITNETTHARQEDIIDLTEKSESSGLGKRHSSRDL